MATWGRCSDSTNTTDPLLDLFIKKGFVTQQEAEQVQAEAEFNRTNQFANVTAPSSQWKITKGIQKVELFGDVRLRYEDRYAADPVGNSIDLQRWRYSVRVGLRGEAFDDFYYGLRLETAANPRSSFVTFGTSTSSGAYQGPFGKSTAGIGVGQAYLGWRPWDWLDVTVGKMPNPLYTTPMVWSGNINPEGAAEHLKYNVGQADFFANLGQFLYADMNPDSASPGLGSAFGQQNDNIFMFAWQGGFDYHVTTNTFAKIAATLYNYTGLQQSSPLTAGALSPYFGDPYIGEGAYNYYGGLSPNNAIGVSGYSPGTQFNAFPASLGGSASVSYPMNQVGLNNLLILEVPFEFDFKISRFDARVFGDAAYNLDGEQRAQAAASAYSYVLSHTVGAIPNSFPAQTHDVKAYQAGFDIGSQGSLGLVNGTTSKKNAWELRAYWQHIEQYSLDPNLIDTDFFEGQENLQGVYAALAYGFSDNLIGTFRYGHANRINDLLGTGGTGQDIPQINPIGDYSIYQVDLTFRF
jgi:hypothetical protein